VEKFRIGVDEKQAARARVKPLNQAARFEFLHEADPKLLPLGPLRNP
jgi:hypothetical protein